MATTTDPNAKPIIRLTKELDILPPRPVLFPWLPSVDALNCCGGSKVTDNPNSSSSSSHGNIFSFDLSGSGHNKKSKEQQPSSSPGTPSTAPLSPDSINNEKKPNDDDGIPDLSRLEEASAVSERTNTTRQRRQQYCHSQHQQLDSLTQVVAEILRVIFFIMSTRQALLGNGPQPISDGTDIPTIATGDSSSKQKQKRSFEGSNIV